MTNASGQASARISTARTSARSASRGSGATSSLRHGGSATSAPRRTSTSSSTGAGRRGRSGTAGGRGASGGAGARAGARGDPAWWVRRAYGATGTLDDDVFVTEYSSIPQLASWVLRQNGRAVPLEPPDLKRDVAQALRRGRGGARGGGH